MSTPANPLDNKDAIVRLGNTIDALVDRFIVPMTQQSFANQQAIEALSAEVRQTTATVNQTSRDVQTLIQVIDDVAAESADDGKTATNNSANIEALLATANADRQENARRFDEQMKQIQAIAESNRALISALANTNGRIDPLEQAS